MQIAENFDIERSIQIYDIYFCIFVFLEVIKESIVNNVVVFNVSGGHECLSHV